MKRSDLVTGLMLVTSGAVRAPWHASGSRVQRKTMPRKVLERILQAITADPPERYHSNPTHMNYCVNGNFDSSMAPEDADARKARCVGVCVSCRYPKHPAQRRRYEKWLRSQIMVALDLEARGT